MSCKHPGMTEFNHPLDEIAKTMQTMMDSGAVCYQKWTCAGCQRRLVAEKPDTLFKTAKCDECGTVTDIQVAGCNYMAVLPVR